MAGTTSGKRPDIMTELPGSILHRIGNTSLLALRNIAPGNGARILMKQESENPTGSMKDRMALAMIEAAEADGRLGDGGTVVEYTGGSTGVSLSLVCAVKGYPLHIVTSDAFAREKLDHMRILGARLRIVQSDSGRMTEKLTRDMIEAARLITAETGGFWTDQLNNTDQLAAYHALAEEIWTQTDGRIDGFVQSVGTAASLRGTGEALRRRDARIRIVAVEPAESAVLSGGPSGAHKIDGIGAGFVVPLWRDGVADRIERVSTEDATTMALRLAREEGLFAGTSTGANVVAALRLAEELGSDATVATVMCDTGMKYLKTFGARLAG
jgi:cysteine synthase A